MSRENLEGMIRLLNRLDEAKIYYTLAHTQEDAISIEVAVPGERWEIDWYVDGKIDVEIFQSGGVIQDSNVLDSLLMKFAD